MIYYFWIYFFLLHFPLPPNRDMLTADVNRVFYNNNNNNKRSIACVKTRYLLLLQTNRVYIHRLRSDHFNWTHPGRWPCRVYFTFNLHFCTFCILFFLHFLLYTYIRMQAYKQANVNMQCYQRQCKSICIKCRTHTDPHTHTHT